MENIYNYFKEYGTYPTVAELKKRLNCFRDLIAYRIVVSMPACHLENEENREEVELKYLYEIANLLPEFLEERGFSIEISEIDGHKPSDMLKESVRSYYRDYIANPRPYGYRSLHVTFYDNIARCHIEVQLRTKEMDDYAEIGPANHLGYEKRQENERSRRDAIPKGECVYFDEAFERGIWLQQLELSKLNVNMFGAADNNLVNDGCGLYRGRLIMSFEHLSRFRTIWLTKDVFPE